MTRPSPSSTLFPYTTLFRSVRDPDVVAAESGEDGPAGFGGQHLRRKDSREITRESLRRRCRSEEHTSELQSRRDLVCRLLLEKKKKYNKRKIAVNLQQVGQC